MISKTSPKKRMTLLPNNRPVALSRQRFDRSTRSYIVGLKLEEWRVW